LNPEARKVDDSIEQNLQPASGDLRALRAIKIEEKTRSFGGGYRYEEPASEREQHGTTKNGNGDDGLDRIPRQGKSMIP
jgi:hypothetical protein